MPRTEHYHDPNAPTPNSLIPAASTVVTDHTGRVLLIERTDNRLWSIPGGAMEPGETISECAIRETREETGITVDIVRLVGIYTNPAHVISYDNGEVRQQFSICFACRPTSGELAPSDESNTVGYYTLAEVDAMNMHPSIRKRISDALANHPTPVIA